ncbi:MAG: WcaI family glycosyltransferase [Tannerellaceae bacterium]|jgi:colanic acid biosynthesis glycosyl transferase WcaI|nr:WcaI family glycosyltransferase [Tannerellaceae bacterium]
MRILIYGINYSPELTGIGKYTGEMAEWLADNNYDVSVITAMPYYPEWKIHDDYKGKLWFKEVKNKVIVYRCPLYVPSKVNSIKRIIHELSFLATSSFRWIRLLFKKRFDLVICVNPPFHLSIYPYLYSKLKKTETVIHIQDLQVDAARSLNMLSNNFALEFMFKLESFFLKRSDYVSTLTDGMKRKIIDKDIPSEKILLLPNWVDLDKIKTLNKENSLRQQFNIPIEDFVILYAGNIGKKQGLDLLINVAEEYVDNKKLHFIIVGAGAELSNLKNMASSKKLENVKFYPLQPYDLLSALLATADLHLVLQRKGASDLVMPSKLTGILASGGCPVVSAERGSSLYSLINENKIGFICEPESKSALTDTINLALKSDIKSIKLNARAYAEKHLSQGNIMKSFMQQVGF